MARHTLAVDTSTGTVDWSGSMREAIGQALSPDVERSANPRVGCVIVDATGAVVGRGHHRGAGTPHAEVTALADAGSRARGATAVVTLEPCRHTGRTGPCTQALMDAGIARVVFACADPTSAASGGGAVLRAAGVDVIAGVGEEEAAHANRAWVHVLTHGRPLVTVKCAMSLDGRVADAGGGPTSISGPASRAHAQGMRSLVDAIVVGTGTALVDDPHLTARDADGRLRQRQPLRVVVGRRRLPATSRVLDDAAETLLVADADPDALMRALLERDVQHALVEGGPTLSAALFAAGLVDEVQWYIAPVLLGAGPVALPPLPAGRSVAVRRVVMMGEDVVVEGGIRDVHGHS